MIVVDVETTGLSPNQHGLVEIGACHLEMEGAHLVFKRSFMMLCRPFPGAAYTETALTINGRSVESLTEPTYTSEAEAVRDFLAWTAEAHDATIAGHNPRWDYEMLLAAATRAGLDWPLDHRTVDLHTLAYSFALRNHWPVTGGFHSSNLGANKIFNMVGLPKEPEPHLAINGAEMESEALSRLLFGEALFERYKDRPVPAHLVRRSGGGNKRGTTK